MVDEPCMSKRHLYSYLRTERRKWELTQAELGALLGISADSVGSYERGTRTVPARVLIASEVLFGMRAPELFPGFCGTAQDDLGRRALAMHDHLEGKADSVSAKKRQLLGGIKDRLFDVP